MSQDDTAAVPKPAGTANTNPPPNTYVPVNISLQDGYLLYRPEDNAFIALYPDEFLEVRKDGEAHNNAIKDLQAANQAVTEASLALAELKRNPEPTVAELRQAQLELDQALVDLAAKSEAAKNCIEAIADLKTDPKKLVEVLPLTMRRDVRQKAWYIPADKLKSAAVDRRIYLVEGSPERSKEPKGKLLDGARLNGDEIKRRIGQNVLDQAKFKKKWTLKPEDGDDYAGQFFEEWSRTMGAQAKEFLERKQREIVESMAGKDSGDPENPYRPIDLKPEAQLMRWSVGAGLEANFFPLQGNWHDKRDKDWKKKFKRAAKAAQFNVKANAEASIALGEAKARTTAYYPHCAGWHLMPAAAGIALDLGHFRLRGDMTLHAVAGASLALEASAELMLTASKQGLRGVPPNAKAVKAKTGAAGSVELFVGLKEGVELAGALQWLNPEGFIDQTSPRRRDPTKTWGEYIDVASVSTDTAIIQGLAAELGFEVSYRNGNFVIAAKASACLGLGGSGSVACKVDAEHIGGFFICIAHQLKQADYRKLYELMEEDVYIAYNQILVMAQIKFKALHDFANSKTYQNALQIKNAYEEAINDMRNKGANFIRQLEKQLREKWGWFAYMPPESRGALIASVLAAINNPLHAQDQELRELSAFCVNELLATSQSDRHLDNTLDRITVDMGRQCDRSARLAAITALLSNTRFAGGLQRAQEQVAAASPLIHRPFMRNDEPDFIVAQLPFSHPMAMA